MECGFCRGTGKVKTTSFVDARKKIERTCDYCRGTGTIITIEEQLEQSRAEERAAIVRWLRSERIIYRRRASAHSLADAIEAGEHRR